MNDDDPLDGADIGETVTVRETSDFWVPALASDATDGSDRMADNEVVETKVVTNSRGGKELRVTVESDVTKRLPRRWDQSDTPRTDSERRQARRRRWASRLARLLPIPVTLGIGLAITDRIMSRLNGDVVIGGDPLTYTTYDLVPVVAIVFFVTMIVFGIRYLPRPGPRGDRI